MSKAFFNLAVLFVGFAVFFAFGGFVALLDQIYMLNYNSHYHDDTCVYAGYNFNLIGGIFYDASVTVIDYNKGVWLRYNTVTTNTTYQQEIFEILYPLNRPFRCYVSNAGEMIFELLNTSRVDLLRNIAFLLTAAFGVAAFCCAIIHTCIKS